MFLYKNMFYKKDTFALKQYLLRNRVIVSLSNFGILIKKREYIDH